MPKYNLAEVEASVDPFEQPASKTNDQRQARREAVAAFAAEYDGTELDWGEDGERAKQVQFEAIAAYAEQHAGTDTDLDKELEQAAIEHFLILEEYEQ